MFTSMTDLMFSHDDNPSSAHHDNVIASLALQFIGASVPAYKGCGIVSVSPSSAVVTLTFPPRIVTSFV